MLCVFQRRIKTTGIFLAYAAKFLSQKLINFLYIPIFIALFIGLIVLCLFEYLAFTSQADPKAVQGDIYLQVIQNVPLTILVVIQLVWGAQFLKDACK